MKPILSRRPSAILVSVLSMICTATSWAQTQPQKKAEASDTVGKDLKEVVVEGRTRRIIEEGVVYIPDKQSKKFAIDAVDLLTHMAIPQLIITPDKSVKTLAGEAVSIFIDYVQAEPADIEGIRTEDVQRVEVLDHPTDARFNGAQHVVNLIMRKYEWGGYTKLVGNGRTMNDDYLHGSLYSKFSHRNWTFDANASGSGKWGSHDKGTMEETFSDFSYGGKHYGELTRRSETDRFRQRDNRQNAGLRAVYEREGSMYISHSVTFSRNGMPVRESRSTVEFSAPLFPTSVATQTSDSQSLMAFLSGNYHFTLPERNSLSVNWSMGANGYHTGSEYRLGDAEPVVNGQKGRLWYPSLLVSHSKRFGHGNSLNTVLNGYYYIHDARYSGTSQARSRKVNSETQVMVTYSQRWDFGLFVSAAAGAYYTLMRENGVNHVHRWSPYGRCRTDYTLNESNSFLLYGEWSRTGVLSANTTGVIRREDELMWSKGNPDLRAREEKWGMLSYTFMPRGNFSLGVNIVYRDISNGQVAEFLTVPGHDGVVRTYSDDSRERELSCNVSATLGLFNRSLILSGTLSAWVSVVPAWSAAPTTTRRAA